MLLLTAPVSLALYLFGREVAWPWYKRHTSPKRPAKSPSPVTHVPPRARPASPPRGAPAVGPRIAQPLQSAPVAALIAQVEPESPKAEEPQETGFFTAIIQEEANNVLVQPELRDVPAEPTAPAQASPPAEPQPTPEPHQPGPVAKLLYEEPATYDTTFAVRDVERFYEASTKGGTLPIFSPYDSKFEEF